MRSKVASSNKQMHSTNLTLLLCPCHYWNCQNKNAISLCIIHCFVRLATFSISISVSVWKEFWYLIKKKNTCKGKQVVTKVNSCDRQLHLSINYSWKVYFLSPTPIYSYVTTFCNWQDRTWSKVFIKNIFTDQTWFSSEIFHNIHQYMIW